MTIRVSHLPTQLPGADIRPLLSVRSQRLFSRKPDQEEKPSNIDPRGFSSNCLPSTLRKRNLWVYKPHPSLQSFQSSIFIPPVLLVIREVHWAFEESLSRAQTDPDKQKTATWKIQWILGFFKDVKKKKKFPLKPKINAIKNIFLKLKKLGN